MNALIRPAKKADIPGIGAIRVQPSVRQNLNALSCEPSDYLEDFFKNQGNSTHWLVAEVIEDGQSKIVGHSVLHVDMKLRRKHCGSFGIMIHEDYHHQGIGRALMEKTLEIADDELMLVRVELQVFIENRYAVELYKQMGFEIEGTMRYGAIRHGKYANEYIMARIRPGFKQE